MSDKHQKHPPLKRTPKWAFHRNEWAVYGTTCAGVKSFFDRLGIALAPTRLAYVDADHSEEQQQSFQQIGKKQFHFAQPLEWGEYDDRLFNWPIDAAIVNGNHYPATRQIVIINSKKRDSLLRRIDQLTQIDMILLAEGESAPYNFLTDKISAQTPILRLDDTAGIATLLQDKLAANIPPLKALILAGGKSKRMQADKAQLAYHDGQSQVAYLAGICQELGLETYISRSHEASDAPYEGFPVIKDRLVDMGPFGAICSAFLHDPTAAYLVLACDLPLINRESIVTLMQQRNPSKYGTAYKLVDQAFPEPLISIYEPKVYQRLLRLLTLGYACPRKILINSEVEIIDLVDATVAFNANTPAERDQALAIIQGRAPTQ